MKIKNNIKSETYICLPFGTMLFVHQDWQGREQTTYQYCFEGSSHFDVEQMQPTPWRHIGNRKDLRNAMVTEGGASIEEANGYIDVLVKNTQWAKRKGKHSMTIKKGQQSYR